MGEDNSKSRGLKIAITWAVVVMQTATIIVALNWLTSPTLPWVISINIAVFSWPVSFGAGIGAFFGKPLKGAFYGALLPVVFLFVVIVSQWK